MAKGKKTFDVQKFKTYINTQLARTDEYADQKFKAAMCVAWENVAHETGNYKGFQHIYWVAQGCSEWYAAGEPDFPEKNKFIHGNLGEYARIYY